jgi:hypothetical protein
MSESIPVTTSALHALFSRSPCALKFLAIRIPGLSCPAAQIQHLFRPASTIEHLQLHIDHFLEAPQMLLQALRSFEILPRLRHLKLLYAFAVKGERARSLLNLLVWRRTHAALESFELVVSVDNVPPPTDMAEFRALGEAGLHVRVTIPKGYLPVTPSVVVLDILQPVN